MKGGRLAGKRAVVTGGGSGIGLASAKRFAAEGASVFVWDVDAGRIGSAVREIASSGHPVGGAVVDISDRQSVASAAKLILDEFGEIDVLMNNVGVIDDFAQIFDNDQEQWDRIFRINLEGLFLVTRALVPSMIAGGGGTVVNTSSIAGIVAGGGTAYTASKHGVIELTRQLSFDYGIHGVRVNAILPGPVETIMMRDIMIAGHSAVMEAVQSVPVGRHTRLEELADLALYLASDESSLSQSACFAADGFWTVC